MQRWYGVLREGSVALGLGQRPAPNGVSQLDGALFF